LRNKSIINELFKKEKEIKIHTDLSATKDLKSCEEKWGQPVPVQTVSWSSTPRLLYTGDDMGYVRCFDAKDFFYDIESEEMLQNSQNHNIKGFCRQKKRNSISALYPTSSSTKTTTTTMTKVDDDPLIYLVGEPHNATSYLGIEFCWAIEAHDDRIITCQATSYGLLTSSADRLVKLWSFEGRPLGSLLQSVPVGLRNRSWEAIVDIETIIKKENEELDGIIEKVSHVLLSPSKPDISLIDFAGMENGAKAAEFSRSELRKRVDRSSKKLSIDFANHKKFNPILDQQNSTLLLPKNYNTNNNSNNNFTPLPRLYDELGASINDEMNSLFSSNKSLEDALKELKSVDGATDFELKTKQMTMI